MVNNNYKNVERRCLAADNRKKSVNFGPNLGPRYRPGNASKNDIPTFVWSIYFLLANYGLIGEGDGAEHDDVHDQLDDAGRL